MQQEKHTSDTTGESVTVRRGNTSHAGRTPKPRGVRLIVWLAGLMLLIGACLTVWYVLTPRHIDSDKYQAVFLTNGQVYFGKLHDYGTSRPYVTDVYYIQANDQALSAETEGDASIENTQTLVKLGDEIHKPEDKMILNPDAILFVENIADDSGVAEAIKNNNQ